MKLDRTETLELRGLGGGLEPRMKATFIIHRKDGTKQEVPVRVRLDTPIEIEALQERRRVAVRAAGRDVDRARRFDASSQ